VAILYGIYYHHVGTLCASRCLPGSVTVDWKKWSKKCVCVFNTSRWCQRLGICVAQKCLLCEYIF